MAVNDVLTDWRAATCTMTGILRQFRPTFGTGRATDCQDTHHERSRKTGILPRIQD